MHPTAAAVIGVFLVLTVHNTVALDPPPQPVPDTPLQTFLARLVTLAAPIRTPTGQQFGGVFFYKQLNNTSYYFDPDPPGTNGSLLINKTINERFAPEINLMVNYLVAAPVKKGPQNVTHVEDFVLRDWGDDLINNYTAAHGNTPPSFAVLYTYRSPCVNCTNVIVNFANNHTNLNLTLAYTIPNPNDIHVNESLNKIRNANVSVVIVDECKVPNKTKRSAGIATCQLNTLQGCLLERLGDQCHCFQNQTDKVMFVNAFAAGCHPEYSQACSESLIKDWLGACQHNTSALRSNFYSLVEACASKALSNPLQASMLNKFTGILNCENCLQAPPKSCGVKQLSACGHRGFRCTTTAGNSMCRDDHYCGLHGRSYSWCYVDDDDHWDYCCLGSCKMNTDQDALMCYAGQETHNSSVLGSRQVHRYCGDAGIKTVKGEACRSDHACGTHNSTDYYWCFKQSESDGMDWDYCCRPDQVCSRNGETYDCFVDVGQNRTKIACNSTREAGCTTRALCPCSGSAECNQNPTNAAAEIVAASAIMQFLLLGIFAVVATQVPRLQLILYIL